MSDEELVGEFQANFYASSEEEANALFDRLSEAAEAILCGRSGEGHTCPRWWNTGGTIRTPEEEDRRAEEDLRVASE